MAKLNGREILGAWTHNENGERIAMNHHGDMVRAERVFLDPNPVLVWETEDGQWLRRVDAIRKGLAVTGRKEKRVIDAPRSVLVPKKTVKRWHSPR